MSKYLAVAMAAIAIAAGAVQADTFQAGCSLCDRYAGGATSTAAQQTALITSMYRIDGVMACRAGVDCGVM